MDKPKFFDACRKGLMAPTLDATEVQGLEAILTAMQGAPLADCAYALATAFHETARTMQPVREAYWLSEAWRKANLRYWPWYGRGYVQLTWEANYRKADAECAAVDLINPGDLMAKPDLAMRCDIAAHVMRKGMDEGWFAGDSKGRHCFGRHLPRKGPASEAQFTAARRIINGTDKAAAIATYALGFQSALVAGGWA